ncbi:hypothetical protein [Bauldia sp.]|uniref:hypothetical protein n=1 Tax=Bauldia sp. TaxID=2575872 RepID=UPI003BACE4DA
MTSMKRLACLAGITTAMCAQAALADGPVSASVLEFADAETLFVADSAGGTIHAYSLPDMGAAPEAMLPYNLLDLDAAIADALGAEIRGISYHDLEVHPVTRDAYIAASLTVDGERQSVVVTVNRDGAVAALDLASLPKTSFEIADAPDEAVTFWRDIPAATFTFTDLDYENGELFVSGLSTGEFASTLRRVPFPFEESAASTGIEIYHAAHGQTETRAPIRAMSVIDVAGTPTVVAAYTCTPLVTIPVSELQDGANISGRTIAELGYGSTPLEVLSFTAYDQQGNGQPLVLVINREMDADLITLPALEEAVGSPGIVQPVEYLGDTAGVETTSIPLSGVFQAADQDAQFLLTLRRNLDTGAMDLVSFRKGAYLRLSEFVSEYNFPDYTYADNQFAEQTRMFQNMLKADEGFPDLAR